MGFCCFFVGVIVRVGSYSGTQRSLVYLFVFSIIFPHFFYIRSAVANPAVAVAIGEVFAGVLARRAALTAGMNLTRVTATRLAVRAAANDALFSVPVSSSLKIGGRITWSAAASVIGGYSVLELLSNDNLEFATDAKLNSDGSYTVTVQRDGIKKNINVNFKPEELSPVFIYIKSVTQGEPDKIVGVSEGYNYPDNAIYYISKPHGSTAPYYFGDNYQDLAIATQQFRTYDLYKPYYRDFERTVTNKFVNSNGDISFTEQLYKFRYIDSESNFEFSIDGVSFSDSVIKNSELVEIYHPDIVGLPYYQYVFVNVLEHKRRLDYDFNPCKTTEYPNGSTITICAPPEDYDYINTDSNFTYQLLVSTNTNYKLARINAVAGTLSDIQSDVQQSLQRRAIDYKILADIFNELLYSATGQTDYDGIPFSSSKPITAREIQSVAESMGLNLTQYDLVYSTIPDNDFLPDIENHYTTVINNINNGHGGGNNNNHDDDNDDYDEFTPPELEEIPTGSDILGFFDDLFPFLRDFEIREKPAECPTVDITVFDKKYTIDGQCPLLQQNKSLFQTIMLIVWAFVSLRIILKS